MSQLQRPVPVLTNWGIIRVFKVIEGQKLPEQMQELIAKGGRVLSIPEAIKQIDRISSISDREAVFKEQERTAKMGLKPKARRLLKPKRGIGRFTKRRPL